MIRTEKLNKTYDRHRRNANHVLKDVSFELPDTGFVCILGPSGCGKTSLLNAIGGLDKFDNGKIITDSVSVARYGTARYEAERNRNFGYIFQNYYLLPEHSVAYNIYLGLHSLKLSHREKLKRIRQALEAVDMSRYIRRKVGELSGGQQQRIAIARALARRPRVIFADEPTGNLDEANTMNICTLLRQISKESLVIMVTHEERIANFFADRIIRLDNGVISGDSSGWQRSGLSMGSEAEVYAGDYEEDRFEADSVTVRVLQEKDAAPVEVTVVALKDRILIKLADGRAITCGTAEEFPALKEGNRPVLTLENMDEAKDTHTALISGAPAPQAWAGHGIRFSMMLQEAKQLLKGGGAKRISTQLFLILLTVLMVWTVSDYLTVSTVDPQTFIRNDSHILEIKMKRGSGAGKDSLLMEGVYALYGDHIAASGLDVDFLPQPVTTVSFSCRLLPQLEAAQEILLDFNYVPLDRLDPATLIHGRMPEKARELVADKWVLEKLLDDDSILSNAVGDLSFFLGQEFSFEQCGIRMTIVGICDTTQPALYMTKSDLLSTTTRNFSLMGLSDFQTFHPGKYDHITLTDDECLVNLNVAGNSMADLVGMEVFSPLDASWIMKAAIEAPERVYAIVSDSQMDAYLQEYASSQSRFYVYCTDKAALKEYLSQPLPASLQNMVIVDVIDDYTEDYEAYMEASSMKLSARTVVTLTVMALSMVMLYLLCRAQVQERIGMLAVYRLLGIPKGKLAGIFAMEVTLASLRTALPTAALAWAVITALNLIEDLDLRMVLPWQAAALVWVGILLYYLLVTLIPMYRLLKLPPAQLAAKYDY